MTAMPSLPPGTLIAEKFRIEGLLGAGAMGAVYAIQHEVTRHRRALKLLHADLQRDPDLVRRFLNEASAAGRVGNPHLVETFDGGILPTGEAYVVMELLEGETLGTVLHRERRLEAPHAVEIVSQAAEGIEAVHRVGIIHRDLKPENLFVTRRDGRPFVKILDFGVSKFATASTGPVSQTRAGMVYGSPAYMPPEQLRGDADVDPRADVFALGVVLYQCLTGALPFEAPSVEALIVRVLTGEPLAIDSALGEIPDALRDVVHLALERDRDKRISSARELIEAMAPFRALADSQALPEPVVANRRNRWSPVLALAALVFLAAGAAFLLLSRSTARPGPQDRPPFAKERPSESPEAPVPGMTSTEIVQEPARAPWTAPPGHKPAQNPSGDVPATVSRTPMISSSPAPLGSAPPSPAESLGLRHDNPFRP